MSDKYKVISAFDGRAGIDNADLRISRRWPARGSVVTFTKEQLEELMYDAAFSNMIREGKLYIEDMQIKKELGIEPEEAKEPTIVLLDEKALERYWKTMPFAQFKIELKKLTKSQLNSLAEYAIRNGDGANMDKINYLSEVSGYQILRGIELERQNKEA